MQFEYTAKSKSGETVRGTIVAGVIEEARRQLREGELFPLAIKPAARSRTNRDGGRSGRSRGRISKRELITFTSQLAIMCRAGVDVASALENILQQCPPGRLKQTLRQVHGDVLSGKSVSAALKGHPHVFGEGYVASMAAAEASGQMPEVLHRLSALLRNELRMRQTLQNLLAYPVLLSCVSLLVVVVLTFFVLPQFSKVFVQMNIPMPWTTALLVGTAAALRSHWWLLLAVAALAATSAFFLFFNRWGRRLVHHLSLNLWVLRDVTRALVFGRNLRQLGMMLDSGVPLLDGLRLTKSSSRNSLVTGFFRDVETEILNGRGLGNTFLTCPFLPAGAAQMIATAEQTGALATVTQMVGEYFEEQGETRLRELATILEPVIIVAMGIIVAFVVASVMLPIFDFAAAPK